jgi:hypothetical protein
MKNSKNNEGSYHDLSKSISRDFASKSVCNVELNCSSYTISSLLEIVSRFLLLIKEKRTIPSCYLKNNADATCSRSVKAYLT